MPTWLVKATWTEDEAEANECWEVDAESIDGAVREVTKRLRFSPHHVEASRRVPRPGETEQAGALRPGEVRRVMS